MSKTLKPTPKMQAAGVSGAVTILLVWVASLFGLDIPEYAAAAIGVVLTWAAGYFKGDGRHAAG
jgi:hypothetical protein